MCQALCHVLGCSGAYSLDFWLGEMRDSRFSPAQIRLHIWRVAYKTATCYLFCLLPQFTCSESKFTSLHMEFGKQCHIKTQVAVSTNF